QVCPSSPDSFHEKQTTGGLSHGQWQTARGALSRRTRNSEDRDLIYFIHFSDRCGDTATTNQCRAVAANGAGAESTFSIAANEGRRTRATSDGRKERATSRRQRAGAAAGRPRANGFAEQSDRRAGRSGHSRGRRPAVAGRTYAQSDHRLLGRRIKPTRIRPEERALHLRRAGGPARRPAPKKPRQLRPRGGAGPGRRRPAETAPSSCR